MLRLERMIAGDEPLANSLGDIFGDDEDHGDVP